MSITLSHVFFAYGEKTVLQDVSLTLPSTGVSCLFGPSGCGKTTLFRLLLGLEIPLGGTISGRPGSAAAVFQENRLLPWLSALDNVALPLNRNRAAAAAALRAVRLEECDFARRPAELSGGMQRRVALARALAFGGDWLLLDEPFTGLDAQTRAVIAARIVRYAETRPVVLITHQKEEIDLLGATVFPLA